MAQKPITIMKQEFDRSLIELVNSSGLPACIIKPSVANLLQLLDQLEQKQLEADQEAWEAEQAEEEAGEEEE